MGAWPGPSAGPRWGDAGSQTPAAGPRPCRRGEVGQSHQAEDASRQAVAYDARAWADERKDSRGPRKDSARGAVRARLGHNEYESDPEDAGLPLRRREMLTPLLHAAVAGAVRCR